MSHDRPAELFVDNHELFVLPGDGELIDPYAAYVSRLPEFAIQAKRAREMEAYSYREIPFLVGSTLLAYNHTLNDLVTFTSGNKKLQEGIPKHCAEMFVFDELKSLNQAFRELSERRRVDMGEYMPIGLATVGTDSIDEIEGVTFKRTPTLHMCPECVNYYDGVSDDLLIATFPKHLKYYEVHSLGDYRAMRDSRAGYAVLRNFVTNIKDFNQWDERNDAYQQFLQSYEASSLEAPVPAHIARLALSKLTNDVGSNDSSGQSKIIKFPSPMVVPLSPGSPSAA
jgi:hypothetical protein